jgi:glucoamylase
MRKDKVPVVSYRWLYGYFSQVTRRHLRTSGIIFGLIAALVVSVPVPVPALDAPNGPGMPSVWARADKDFIGTSASAASKVYFTGAQGILTEVFYPTPDRVQNVDMEFLVTDKAKTWGDEEKRQKMHDISQVSKRAMEWKAVTTADNKKWRITKIIFSDPGRNSVIQLVTFETLEIGKRVSDYNLYVLNNPAINNSGGGADYPQGRDNSRTLVKGGRTMLVASEPNSTSSSLAVSRPWVMSGGNAMVSNGFVGINDGYTDLFGGSSDLTMNWRYSGAYSGNVAQMGWISLPSTNIKSTTFTVVLGFGRNEDEAMSMANATLGSNLTNLANTYRNEWVAYTSGLDDQGGMADDQYYLAAMTLKCIQDKSTGAMIAGPGTPWGESNGDSNQGGYHLVWARDLFKFASALIAAGDTASADKAVDFLFNVQMLSSNPGCFPQNSFVDGTPYWRGIQMDEVAMPIILAWRLHRVDLWPKIKLAAEYLAKTGPWTEQERWEEMAGYSPSTIAAEVAGLVCAAGLARDAGDTGSADFYLKTADKWRNNVANWTFTTTGFYGDSKYYIRIAANPNPNEGLSLLYKNGAGTHDERSIIDGGFLELVRMGVMSPTDWTIIETLPEYDAILKQTIPGKGDAWFRYNYDAYGEYNDGRSFDGSGRGRLWPIFTAERGIYEIARSGNGASGAQYHQALKAFSSQAGLIPEQVWNTTANITGWVTETPPGCVPGTATRSMRPLSWAMGEYINLVAAMKNGRTDAPSVVCERYLCDRPQAAVTFNVTAPARWGENVCLVGSTPLLSNWVPDSGILLSPTGYPVWSETISLPASTQFQYKYIKRASNGSIIWESGSNRTVMTPSSGSIVLNDTFK